MKLPHRDVIAFQWSMALMTRAFRDLAVSFAAVDPELADEAVRRTETMVAAEMERMLQEPPKRVPIAQLRAAIAEAVTPLREMTQSARSLIQQAGKPKH